jgi:hypothetical protein
VTRQQEISAQTIPKFLHGRPLQRDFSTITREGVDIRIDFHRGTEDCSVYAIDWQRCRNRRGKGGLNKAASIHDCYLGFLFRAIRAWGSAPF